jgi:hypothetical protein
MVLSMSDDEEAIAIGVARLWRDLGAGVKQSDASASWFRVLNMPKNLEADLFWVTAKQCAFIVRGRSISHLSAETYSSKEVALEGLKTWLREEPSDCRVSSGPPVKPESRYGVLSGGYPSGYRLKGFLQMSLERLHHSVGRCIPGHV